MTTHQKSDQKPCSNTTPPWFVGHWRDWHRGHGCSQDDGAPRSDAARTEVEQHAANAQTGHLTDAELRFLRAATTSGDELLVRALDELTARRAGAVTNELTAAELKSLRVSAAASGDELLQRAVNELTMRRVPDPHAISISHELPSRSEALVLQGGHRAHCSCGWWSDCHAQLSDTQRAGEVHLRRARREGFDDLLARSSIGAALDDVRVRGIDAHLLDLEKEMPPRKKPKKKPQKLSAEDKAFMRGFGIALATIWRCQHDGQMVQQLIKESNFTLASFRSVGLIDADYAAIGQAIRRRST